MTKAISGKSSPLAATLVATIQVISPDLNDLKTFYLLI